MEGKKFDSEKLQWDLIPMDALEEIVKVIDFGARKYSPNNWKKVLRADRRYVSALLRHFKAWKEGEKFDPETGISHLAHIGCNILFLLWFDLHPEEVPDLDDYSEE